MKEQLTWEALIELEGFPRKRLALLPTPMQQLENFSKTFDGVELWMKRDDLSGLEGGGNKTRKLEFLVGDALEKGADTLVTIGAIQSNHTRQTAAAAAKSGLKCALMHFGWTKDAGPNYRKVGNILLSSIMGAELYVDDTPRKIDDQGPLKEFCDFLVKKGKKPYLIPGGASEHKLGSLGYMVCAAEIVKQSKEENITFDYVLHCTGSSSTQAGLIAGFAALGEKIRVIGIADDDETVIKKGRVLSLANDTLEMIGINTRVTSDDVEIFAGDVNLYGISDAKTFEGIKLLAQSEGIIADPVYEGKAIRGLRELYEKRRFEEGSRILLMHLGGSPAVHAYANQFDEVLLSTEFYEQFNNTEGK
ncbi:MAG: 1-aminocyclopropane-1-carboxylate deaminase [delta proteobacterium ML8_F1]|nr:MAG: 1-aminocyclopropane-1-carboxylate deaminase [delta proteobacterium ML8_F1]